MGHPSKQVTSLERFSIGPQQCSRVGPIDRSLGFVFGVLRGALIAVVVVVFGQWLIGPNLPSWASESKSLPILQRAGDSLIAMLPPDLEKQVTDILQKRGIGGDETPADATPAEEGTDELENGAPPVSEEAAPAGAA